MINKKIILATLSLSSLFFHSCENDFSETGASIIDRGNFETNIYTHTAIKSETKQIEKVQANNIGGYNLGVFKNIIYGTRKSDLIIPLKLSSTNPDFGKNPIIDSVVLSIPYYSRQVKNNTGNKLEYQLDSIYSYGNKSSLKLAIYQNTYFIEGIDPNDNFNPRIYYSNEYDLFNTHKEAIPLYENTNFIPSSATIKVREAEKDKPEKIKVVDKSPRLYIKLPTDKFKQLIIDKQGSAELISNANFMDYFRGLHLQVEPNSPDGGYMSLLNIKDKEAKISIYYTSQKDANSNKRSADTFELEFAENIINVSQQQGGNIPADDNLYIAGGQGAMIVIDVFTDKQELEELRQKNWLINEANLEFYINEEQSSNITKQPQRLFIYDLTNNQLLVDYNIDQTTNNDYPSNSKTVHLGKIEKDKNGNSYYKIRITGYVNDILRKKYNNTKLGVVVAQNVNQFEMKKAELTTNNEKIELPNAEISALGASVFHSEKSTDKNKQLKVKIYYTKTTN